MDDYIDKISFKPYYMAAHPIYYLFIKFLATMQSIVGFHFKEAAFPLLNKIRITETDPETPVKQITR